MTPVFAIGTLTILTFAPRQVAAQTPAQAGTRTDLKTIRLEAEIATLTGASVSTQRPGFSGRGFVTDLDAEGDKIVWKVPNVPPGLYEIRLRYCAPFGEKGYDLVIDGAKTSGMLAGTGPKFATAAAGKIELKKGAHTFAIEKGWGYYDIDALELVPASQAPPLQPISKTLSDRDASPQARALMSYLVDLYGQKTVSGQQNHPADIAYVKSVSDQTPAIIGNDLVEYSPSRAKFGAKPDPTTEKMIETARGGQVLTLSWHWNAPSGLYNRTYTDSQGKKIEAPWWRGFNTDASTFDLQKALANPNSQDYRLLVRDMDVIAAELKKLQKAKVPVLWRPLHEAEGGWFWWGAKGPEPFKKLWRLMFNRFTNTHKLHNLIWVYTSAGNMNWYPGDDVVDIVGTDSYPQAGDSLSGLWEDLRGKFDGKKMLALTEIGGAPDIEKMRYYDVRWAYFMSWEGSEVGPTSVPKEMLAKTYRSPLVVNQDQLAPLWKRMKNRP